MHVMQWLRQCLISAKLCVVHFISVGLISHIYKISLAIDQFHENCIYSLTQVFKQLIKNG